MTNDNIFKNEKFKEIKFIIFMSVSKKIINYIFGAESLDFTDSEKTLLRTFAVEILKTIEGVGDKSDN